MVSARPIADVQHRPLHGARVAFTGRLASMTRAAARAAVRDAGGEAATTVSGRTTMLVVGQGGLPLKACGGPTELLRRAEELRRRGARLRIVPESRFIELLGDDGARTAPAKAYDAEAAAAAVGLDADSIRRWEHLGLVRSADGRCDFGDIASLQTIASLMRRGVPARVIAESLRGLARLLPEADHPLAQLSIVTADRAGLLAQIGDSLVDPAGQLHLDFFGRGAPAPDGPPRALHEAASARTRPTGANASPEDCFEHALAHEEREDFAGAADWYRRAVAGAPDWADAYFNLGNALRMLGRIDGAEEMYRLALAHDGGAEAAWYNLADMQQLAGRTDEAIESLRRAIDAAPGFADAHYNLALCLDEAGRADEAQPHWRAYLTLDRDSAWAGAARDRLR